MSASTSMPAVEPVGGDALTQLRGVDLLAVDGVEDVDAAVDKRDGTVGGLGGELSLDALEFGGQGGVVDAGDDVRLLPGADEALEAEEGVERFRADLSDGLREVDRQPGGGRDEGRFAVAAGDGDGLVHLAAELPLQDRLRLPGLMPPMSTPPTVVPRGTSPIRA